MNASLSKQLFTCKIGYEALVTQFIESLMKNEGMHVRVPIPIYKTNPPEDFEEEKREIWKRTCELLEMMGIKYQTNLTSLSICILEVNADWTKGMTR